jgi:hypothetical protein
VVNTFFNGSHHVRNELRPVLDKMVKKGTFDLDSMMVQLNDLFDMSLSSIIAQHLDLEDENYLPRCLDILNSMADILEDRSAQEEDGTSYDMELKYACLLIYDVISHAQPVNM